MNSAPSIRSVPRREFLKTMALAAVSLPRDTPAAGPEMPFRLNYILASAMYGYGDLATVVAQAHKTDAEAIDIWPKVHGNQREQIEEMGHDRFVELLAEHNVRLGGIACYRLGPFGLQAEMRFARKVGGPGVILVCGARGPKDATGKELRAAVAKFIEQLKPHVAVAEETGCVIAIENHANSMVDSPDSIRWFSEMAKSEHLGIAFAPHHLPQDADLQASIVRDIGPTVKFVYAQQHGKGSSKKMPKEDELLQMPGRGPLDFAPIVKALKAIEYKGPTEIFMHPVPRGVPILESPDAITAEINRSRAYLEKIVAGLA